MGPLNIRPQRAEEIDARQVTMPLLCAPEEENANFTGRQRLPAYALLIGTFIALGLAALPTLYSGSIMYLSLYQPHNVNVSAAR